MLVGNSAQPQRLIIIVSHSEKSVAPNVQPMRHFEPLQSFNTVYFVFMNLENINSISILIGSINSPIVLFCRIDMPISMPLVQQNGLSLTDIARRF